MQTQQLQFADFSERAGAFVIDWVMFLVLCLLIHYVIFKVFSPIFLTGEHIFLIPAYSILSIDMAGFPSVDMINERVRFDLFSAFVSIFVYIVIHSYFLTSKWQATPGKMYMKIFVVDERLCKLSVECAIARSASVGILALLAIYLLISGHAFAIKVVSPGYIPADFDGNFDALIDSMFKSAFYIALINLFFILVVFGWYIMAMKTKNKTAFHDMLAGSRVVKWQLPK